MYDETVNQQINHLIKKSELDFNPEDNTYVHGIVKNIWSGTFNASATSECPGQMFAKLRESTKWYQTT